MKNQNLVKELKRFGIRAANYAKWDVSRVVIKQLPRTRVEEQTNVDREKQGMKPLDPRWHVSGIVTARVGKKTVNHFLIGIDETRNFISPLPLVIEAVADIAFMAGAKEYHSGDSREDIDMFYTWAVEFEKLRRVSTSGEESYNGDNYMSAIEAFALKKLNESGNTYSKQKGN